MRGGSSATASAKSPRAWKALPRFAVNLCHLRFELERALVAGNSLGLLALRLKNISQVDVRLGQRRTQSQRAAKALLGEHRSLPCASSPMLQIHLRLSNRLELERAFIALRGLLEAAQSLQRGAQLECKAAGRLSMAIAL